VAACQHDPMRRQPTVLHLDLDAFFAAVEQRDKPSLRGRPVVVGGTGARGVVATASYEARRFGVRSAMSTTEARSRCPHAAYLAGRFPAYRAASEVVMAHLRRLSPLVEPLSLDEAFVDLAAGPAAPPPGVDATSHVTAVADRLRADVREATGGLTASVGVATSKLVAKIASELDKPDGLVVVPAGTEQALLAPMPVTVVPGVGPATNERLRRLGVRTVGDLASVDEAELVSLLGPAAGTSFHRLAAAVDDRPVVAFREAKSVSVEDTFERDLTDPALLAGIAERMATRVAERLSAARLSGRTVTLKVRRHDFSTSTRSATLPGPTDEARVVARVARRLLAELDVSDGVRLLGVGVSGLGDWIQQGLWGDDDPGDDNPEVEPPAGSAAGSAAGGSAAGGSAAEVPAPTRRWLPGQDVHHAELGPGWVWGAGLGRVTVRFETRDTPPGPVRTYAVDDPALQPRTAPSEKTGAGGT
jgi:DNA polymerase-4